MTVQRMRDAAQLLGEFGNGKMANELSAFADWREAFAPMIAAAPALFDALQNLAYYTARISPAPYGHDCHWCTDCVQRAKDEARTALKKARGERPQGLDVETDGGVAQAKTEPR